jgi:hydroxymethylpyrimidine/phosphomethylpyrimidine kinase
MRPVALSIAGSDPSGGAGIQADLKTFQQFGVYGEAVITLLTAQNTMGITRVEIVPARMVTEQLRALLEDIPPDAAKTGALGSPEVVNAVASAASEFAFALVVDPVFASSGGWPLASAEAMEAIRTELLPRATLAMPNAPEAEVLSGLPIRTLDDMRRAACVIQKMGPRAVLIKGGHLTGAAATDVLYDGSGWQEYQAPRIETRHTHGTGCAYSAAVTAGLARGLAIGDAVAQAKAFITEAIRTSPGFGRGCGPVNHHAEVS